MTNQEKYDLLYAAIKKQEDENECPLLMYDAWFNTDGNGWIDMETSKGATVTNNIEEIEELLAESGLVLNFEGDQPRVERR